MKSKNLAEILKELDSVDLGYECDDEALTDFITNSIREALDYVRPPDISNLETSGFLVML